MTILHKTIMDHEEGLFPMWFMRQAGRYLPEYMEVKNNSKGFMHMVLTPEIAKKITLQPIERYPDLDAAIIFSDILVIPWAMGQPLEFNPSPKLGELDPQIWQTDLNVIKEKLKPIYKAIELTRRELDTKKSLIGFAGAPWTILRYMMSGPKDNPNPAYKITSSIRPQDIDAFDAIFRLDRLTKAIVMHLDEQVKAGCDCVQLFDSWAGELGEDFIIDWCYNPIAKIVEEFKKLHPNVPIIGYPRGIGKDVKEFCHWTGVDCVSISPEVDPKWAVKHIPQYAIQGGMDPEILIKDPSVSKIDIIRKALYYIRQFEKHPYVFNLGGGISKHTDPKSLEILISVVKQNREYFKKRKQVEKKKKNDS